LKCPQKTSNIELANAAWNPSSTLCGYIAMQRRSHNRLRQLNTQPLMTFLAGIVDDMWRGLMHPARRSLRS